MKKIVLLVLIMYGGKLFGKEIENKEIKKEFNIIYSVMSCADSNKCLRNYFNIGKITIYSNRYDFKKRKFNYDIDKKYIGSHITKKIL